MFNDELRLSCPSSILQNVPDHLLKQLIQASHHRTVLSPAPTGLAYTSVQHKTKMYFIKGIFQPQKGEGFKRGINRYALHSCKTPPFLGPKRGIATRNSRVKSIASL
jgi:hypothetical protein